MSTREHHEYQPSTAVSTAVRTAEWCVQLPFGVCVLVRALRTFPFSAAAATYLVTLVRSSPAQPRAGCSVRAP